MGRKRKIERGRERELRGRERSEGVKEGVVKDVKNVRAAFFSFPPCILAIGKCCAVPPTSSPGHDQ